MPEYEFHHVVLFEDTNLVGNVYFTKYFSWQGRCREQFLLQKAPEVLDALRQGLALMTTRCSCEFWAELTAGDDVLVRMSLGRQAQTSLVLRFDYFVLRDGRELRVALGEQQVACMRRIGDKLVPEPIPAALRLAIAPYTDGGELAAAPSLDVEA